jgi:pyruvate formate lyase activating enzyme
MNIDIKAFNNDFYRRLCGGSLEPVLETARTACARTHVELTTLIIPEENDAVPELEDLAAWIAGNCGRSTPCHLTAYHPSYQFSRAAATAAHLRNAGNIFRSRLDHVYLGNLAVPGFSDTVCPACGAAVVARSGFAADLSGMRPDGRCAACGADNHIIT